MVIDPIILLMVIMYTYQVACPVVLVMILDHFVAVKK